MILTAGLFANDGRSLLARVRHPGLCNSGCPPRSIRRWLMFYGRVAAIITGGPKLLRFRRAGLLLCVGLGVLLARGQHCRNLLVAVLMTLDQGLGMNRLYCPVLGKQRCARQQQKS